MNDDCTVDTGAVKCAGSYDSCLRSAARKLQPMTNRMPRASRAYIPLHKQVGAHEKSFFIQEANSGSRDDEGFLRLRDCVLIMRRRRD